MFRKTAVTLFCFVLGFHVAFAQNANKQNVVQWEFLEVSNIRYLYYESIGSKDYRDYKFLTSGQQVSSTPSLSWMRDSGWEIVGTISYGENANGLFFKRRYDIKRTDEEIKWLKKEFEKETITPQTRTLIDLDETEFKQKLADFNKSEELRIRTALEQIKDFPIKIVSVGSKSGNPSESVIGAEIVLDATSILLKDGRYYRASEAEKYYQDAVKQILEKMQVTLQSSLWGNSEAISKGSYQPQEIGKFSVSNIGIYLKTSIIITVKSQQNIVSQGVVNGRWKTEGK